MALNYQASEKRLRTMLELIERSQKVARNQRKSAEYGVLDIDVAAVEKVEALLQEAHDVYDWAYIQLMVTNKSEEMG